MLAEIKAFIEPELSEFQSRFKESMRSRVPLLDRIAFYLIKSKGKQIRPIFVLATAKSCGGIKESTFTAASLIELLHTASLVHDDVVDNAYKRRGFFSINALWKHKAAVLVGDFLLSKGLLLALDHKEYELLHIVSEAVRQISEGELLQMEKSRVLNLDESIYFDIIRQKTASLIAAACAAGAFSAGVSPEMVERMRLFGETAGLSFQIKDDLFDYGKEEVGKPLGIDIKEKKLTLPLIYALKHCDSGTRNHMIHLIKRHSEDKTKRGEIIEFVRSSGGIEYATEKMNKLADDAVQLLEESDALTNTEHLKNLVRFIIARRK